MTPALLTVDEVRAELGAKAVGLSDAALEEIARRVLVVSLAVLEQVGQRPTAARR